MDIIGQQIDNGFILIGEETARKLAGGSLPKHGMEKLVANNGNHYWLSRTQYNGKSRWSIRPSSWVLEKGKAILKV